jgi:hypothetical protein
LPAIDDVADQINAVGVVTAQKIEKALRLATARAEMNIGKEESTERTGTVLIRHDV